MLILLLSWFLGRDLDQSDSNLPVYLTCAVCGLGAYLVYTTFFKKAKSWDKYGVKQVTVAASAMTDQRAFFQSLIEKHGKTLGYVFKRLTLVTTDLELMRKVMVEEFSSFHNRVPMVSRSLLLKSVLFTSDVHLWKRKRQILSPNFSAAKLKHILKIVNEKAARLADTFTKSADEGKLVGIRKVCGSFTSEVIAQTAFGCQIDCLGKDDNDEFVDHINTLFNNPQEKYKRYLLTLASKFTLLKFFFVKVLGLAFFDEISKKSGDYFAAILKDVIAERMQRIKEDKSVPMDYLQMLIQSSDFYTGSGKTNLEDKERLSLDDIIGEMILIIFAGYETTSSTIRFMLYMLAAHPEIQEKVYQEIQEKVTSPTPTYDEVFQLSYTRQVIDETMRLHPVVPILSRNTTQEHQFDGFTVPKGASVVMPVFLNYQDPEIYPDPEKFDPDRFSAEEVSKRHPMAFVPFGSGPRQCLGLRLAYLEIKIALVHIFRKVRVVQNERTVPPTGGSLELGLGTLPIVKTPIQLAVERRQ